jgi:hypothetical protein
MHTPGMVERRPGAGHSNESRGADTPRDAHWGGDDLHLPANERDLFAIDGEARLIDDDEPTEGCA